MSISSWTTTTKPASVVPAGSHSTSIWLLLTLVNILNKQSKTVLLQARFHLSKSVTLGVGDTLITV